MPKAIVVSIADDGKVFVESDGFKGPSCVKAIADLFDGFVEVEGFEHKSDFYEEEETVTSGAGVIV